MPFPGVSVNVDTGNLLRALPNLDSVPALAVTVATEGLQGVVTTVFSLKDAENKGITSTSEAFLHYILTEFYTELGGNKKLYIMGFADTVLMSKMLDVTDEAAVYKMIKDANGEITHIGVCRNPDTGDVPGDAFLNADVALALTAGKSLAANFQAKNQPVRLLIEGQVNDDEVANSLDLSALSNGYCGIVLGSTKADGSASVGLALARIVKYPAHVKIGDGQNGSLTAGQLYIGADKIEDRPDVEDLHDQGFITFHRRPGVAGYFFGVDNMCTDDDTSILVHGNVLDKAQRISAATYTPYIESNIRINDDGTINETDAKQLENQLKTQILANMEGQISNVDVIIDTTQNIVDNSTLQVKVKILPLGYLTWIEVTLGFTTSI
ncbi:MAG: DUF2586 family protein [Bacteroidales bacterium]|nr:DUF2586 family protein [Bacteroidales bacterium]